MSRPKLYRRYELLEKIRKDPRASIRELCEAMGIRAPSQIHSLLRELEEEGLIAREPRLARSIQIGGVRRAKSEMKARHYAQHYAQHCAISKAEDVVTRKTKVSTYLAKTKKLVAAGKKRRAAMSGGSASSSLTSKEKERRLQDRIDAIARRSEQGLGVDVMNDWRRGTFRHQSGIHAVKVG